MKSFEETIFLKRVIFRTIINSHIINYRNIYLFNEGIQEPREIL